MKKLFIIVGVIALFCSCSDGKEELPETPSGGALTIELLASDEAPVCYQRVGFYFTHNAVDIESAEWNFGDGDTGTGAAVEHSYREDGTYSVSLKVTDKEGRTAEGNTSVTVAGRSLSKALKYFDWNRTWVCAHRCNMGDDPVPENSTSALLHCIEKGSVDFVEVDPRMTKDGVIVLMHDKSISRTTTGSGNVSDLYYHELRNFRLKLGDGTVTEDTIPTLKQFLEVAKGKMYIDLDYHDKVPTWEIYSVVKECDMLDEVMFYTSSTSDLITSLQSYSPAPVIFTHTSNENHAKSWNQQGIYVTQISAGKVFDSNLVSVAGQNSLVVLSNALVQNGITIDSDIRYNGDYSGLDRMLGTGVNIIQTDQGPLVDTYLRSINKRY